MIFNKKQIFKLDEGQAALSTIVLIGGIITLITIALVIIISSYMTSAYGYQNAQRALAVANTGADDALLRLIRNKDFQNSLGYIVYSGSDSATVTVTQEQNKVIITSIANILSYSKKVRIIASIDSNGEVNIIKREQVE